MAAVRRRTPAAPTTPRPEKLAYAEAARRLELDLPADFWHFWANYYRHPEKQEEYQRWALFATYNDLLWRIHREAEQRSR